jgi:PTH1 family peptidyl-tRNA hydrolase
MLFLIVGLGNPGREYADSRHNVGFRCLDALAERAGAVFRADRSLEAAWGQGRIGARQVLLLKPLIFMNLSGRAVAAACGRHALGLQELLAVHDDMDLELGCIQLRPGGGDGGHCGIRSLGAALGSLEFARMRLGVGRPGGARDAVDHVLGAFAPDEAPRLADMLARASQAVEVFLAEGLTPAMNRFNPWRPDRTPDSPNDGGTDA